MKITRRRLAATIATLGVVVLAGAGREGAGRYLATVADMETGGHLPTASATVERDIALETFTRLQRKARLAHPVDLEKFLADEDVQFTQLGRALRGFYPVAQTNTAVLAFNQGFNADAASNFWPDGETFYQTKALEGGSSYAGYAVVARYDKDISEVDLGRFDYNVLGKHDNHVKEVDLIIAPKYTLSYSKVSPLKIPRTPLLYGAFNIETIPFLVSREHISGQPPAIRVPNEELLKAAEGVTLFENMLYRGARAKWVTNLEKARVDYTDVGTPILTSDMRVVVDLVTQSLQQRGINFRQELGFGVDQRLLKGIEPVPFVTFHTDQDLSGILDHAANLSKQAGAASFGGDVVLTADSMKRAFEAGSLADARPQTSIQRRKQVDLPYLFIGFKSMGKTQDSFYPLDF